LTVPAFPLPFPQPGATTAFFPKAGVYISLPLNLRPTYVQQWNLAIDKQVRPQLAADDKLSGQQDEPCVAWI